MPKASRGLAPIKAITTILCDSHQPTILMIFRLKEKILASMTFSEDDSELVKSVKAVIADDMRNRYETIKDTVRVYST